MMTLGEFEILEINLVKIDFLRKSLKYSNIYYSKNKLYRALFSYYIYIYIDIYIYIYIYIYTYIYNIHCIYIFRMLFFPDSVKKYSLKDSK